MAFDNGKSFKYLPPLQIEKPYGKDYLQAYCTVIGEKHVFIIGCFPDVIEPIIKNEQVSVFQNNLLDKYDQVLDDIRVKKVQKWI